MPQSLKILVLVLSLSENSALVERSIAFQDSDRNLRDNSDVSLSCIMALQSDFVVDASKFRSERASEEVKQINEILMDRMKSEPKWFQVRCVSRSIRPH